MYVASTKMFSYSLLCWWGLEHFERPSEQLFFFLFLFFYSFIVIIIIFNASIFNKFTVSSLIKTQMCRCAYAIIWFSKWHRKSLQKSQSLTMQWSLPFVQCLLEIVLLLSLLFSLSPTTWLCLTTLQIFIFLKLEQWSSMRSI